MATRNRVLALTALALFTTSTAADAASPPLLEVHTERADAAGPAFLGTVDSTLFVDRDGATELRSVRRDALNATSFTTTVLRGPAPAAELAALRAALAAARPGQFPPLCIGPLLPLGSDRRIRLIWYSAKQRSSRTDVLFDGPGVCSAGLLAVLEAADALGRALPGAPSTVVDSSPCVTDRQCAEGLKCCYSGGIPGLPSLCLPPTDGECPLFP